MFSVTRVCPLLMSFHTENLSREVEDYVCSVIHHHDLVPRLCMASIEGDEKRA